MGQRVWAKMSPACREARRQAALPSWCTRRPRGELQLQALLGCEHLGVTIRDVSPLVAEHTVLRSFVDDFESRHGRDAQVRIVTRWAWKASTGSEIPYIEFATLAAIYSKIGAAKAPVRVTRDEIRRRAHGFKSGIVFMLEMRNRESWISKRQIRSAIERLRDRKCFARMTYARRETYYSHRMTGSQLAEGIFARKVQRQAARHACMQANDALTKRIEAERRRLATPDASKGATGPAT